MNEANEVEALRAQLSIEKMTHGAMLKQRDEAIRALHARIAELEEFKASVPWEAINGAFGDFFGEAWVDEGSPVDVIEKWLDAHAPKEAAE